MTDTDNIIEVGAKVRRASWGSGLFARVTAIGEEWFLGRDHGLGREKAYDVDGPWERYVEPPTDTHFVNLYGPAPMGGGAGPGVSHGSREQADNATWAYREAVAIRNSNGEWRLEKVES